MSNQNATLNQQYKSKQ